jgi:hypothetical protein
MRKHDKVNNIHQNNLACIENHKYGHKMVEKPTACPLSPSN